METMRYELTNKSMNDPMIPDQHLKLEPASALSA